MSAFTFLRVRASRAEGGGLGSRVAFTLVELLVSLAILVLIMATVASIVSQTGTLWHQTVSRVQEFREARDAFEAITRRLSQATLNTYWDYDNPTNPKKYIRQSELRFISMSGTQTFTSGPPANPPPARPTHAVFFQAPLGFVAPDATTSGASYRGMENLLNSWGYYVEYNSDVNLRPGFMSPTSPAPRIRFRLMEFMQSSQDMSLYAQENSYAQQAAQQTPPTTGNAYYTYSNIGASAWSWFLGVNGTGNGINATLSASTAPTAPVHILAENVLALVILPKLTSTQESGLSAPPTVPGTALAPNYTYDSTTEGSATNAVSVSDQGMLNSMNQLPPIVSVTMVAIDETTAMRLTSTQNQAILTELSSLFTSSANYTSDLTGVGGTAAGGGLEPFLQGMGINYRVFTTEVSIRGAKWSTDQSK